IPTPVANTGYQAGSWTPETPTEETEVKDGAEYTYTFVPEARNVTVNYIDDQDPANELKASETVPTEYDAEYNV
ncbi:hypothetical protein, partial [Faecalicoccus pleomorphus]|uniref:hypothetical protein n=1 Tax=Faecalicoccus pleomorphus TaxID=1323 RepID=UPI00195FDC77